MRMKDEEIQKVFDDYNRIRKEGFYWTDAGLKLVEYLHAVHGMKYQQIYDIAEGRTAFDAEERGHAAMD